MERVAVCCQNTCIQPRTRPGTPRGRPCFADFALKDVYLDISENKVRAQGTVDSTTVFTSPLFESPGLHNERPCDRILEHARLSGSGAAQAFDPTCFLEVLEGEGALPPHFADEELPVAAQAAVIMHVPADGEAAAATGEEVGASGSKGSLSIIRGLGP